MQIASAHLHHSARPVLGHRDAQRHLIQANGTPSTSRQQPHVAAQCGCTADKLAAARAFGTKQSMQTHLKRALPHVQNSNLAPICTITPAQYLGMGMLSATSFSPKAPPAPAVMSRTSQHSEIAQPPAGHPPQNAAKTLLQQGSEATHIMH